MEPILLCAIHSEVAARAADRSSTAPTVPPLHHSIPEEYAEFADVFDEIAADSLPEHRPYDLKIDLEEGASLPLGRIYPLSEKELVTLKDFIDKQLATGAITPSSLPYGAPVLLAHAYHLVRIAEGDEWKTTFRTRYGSYEWKVMPFGLTNAPAAFQCFVNDIFSDMLDVCVIVYLDDILIYSDTPEEHREHVKEVLRRLRKHWLYANPDKCEAPAQKACSGLTQTGPKRTQ
ncbi:retrotransposon nucleocapsid protein [Lentinula edodes]|uniref:Retrotransposon nucleocapsid protein n=1 Tax=Lentinula edodes TaxID=5353 RepID=A0A1Q3ESH2_LENED|nr:retrotransposon nucleocapsid protein [Lentinula edodes]